MAEENDDLDIVIQDDDAPLEGASTPAAKAPVTDPVEGLDDLKAQLAAERERADRAVAAANEMGARANGAITETHESNLALLKTAMDTTDQAAGMLKGQYAAAMRAGDFDAAAEIQEQMAIRAAEKLQLQQGYDALKAQPPQRVAAPVSNDPVEAIASGLTEKSARWVRQHPEFARDPKKLQQMIGADSVVQARGVVPESDEYFRQVEEILGVRGRPVDRNDEDDTYRDTARATGGRQVNDSPPPAAPVGRGGSGGNTASGNRPNTVRLTAAEREAAASSGVTIEEYAKNKLALQREGKLH
jgi:hypothetical protein